MCIHQFVRTYVKDTKTVDLNKLPFVPKDSVYGKLKSTIYYRVCDGLLEPRSVLVHHSSGSYRSCGVGRAREPPGCWKARREQLCWHGYPT